MSVFKTLWDATTSGWSVRKQAQVAGTLLIMFLVFGAIWYVVELHGRLSQYEPIDDVARTLSPGKDHAEALKDLADEVNNLMTQIDSDNEQVFVALLDSCYVEIVRNRWTIHMLQKLEQDRIKARHPRVDSCTKLANHEMLSTFARSVLNMYVASMGEAAMVSHRLWTACNQRPLHPQEVENSHNNAETWMRGIEDAKSVVAEALAGKGRGVPIQETFNPEEDSLGICIPRGDALANQP